jgi:hypothetical protein
MTSFPTITISSTASAGGGSTWSTNASYGANISITTPTGYSTSGSTLVVVVIGSGATSSTVTSDYAYFSSAYSVGSFTKVVYVATQGAPSGPGATITVSSISGYAMAYAYISGGSSGLSTSSGSSSSSSAYLSNPMGMTASPRIFAVSTTSSLNLATAASSTSGGGPTWGTATASQHPSDVNLSGAVWSGTGPWTSSASPTVTSNFGNFFYVTGITSSS